MRGLLIAGNWKMNGLIGESVQLIKEIQPANNEKIEIVLAPPFTALHAVNAYLSKDDSGQINNFFLAAQDVFWEEKGAYTGEVSPEMLANTGCYYVIIGHSERRQFFHETNKTVNKKIKASLKANLQCIVCIGETLEQRENGNTFSIIESQIKEGFANISSEELDKCIIAYEPVWAIGTGKTATPEQAEEIHQFIRKKIEEIFNKFSSEKMKILYGGSVNPGNVEGLLSKEDIDGALVGGASLKAESFNKIIQAGENTINN
ncbi:MAG: triose-phosphate isomerase [Nitrospinae bacterium]|jgi:triosephosphate isomerase|nr:triose-phosphate isomerase [Nitrospinota bacterium]HJN03229.1 triose-phosphate isomerase [Nitrospinota bacterium]